MLDEQLVNIVRDYIKAKGCYVHYKDLEADFGKTRIYYTYRGINLTELNAEFGYVRRKPQSSTPPKEYSKAEVEAAITNLVKTQGHYIPLVAISRKHRLISEHIVRALGIDVHTLNVEAGYNKSSSKEKFVLADLRPAIEDYILKSKRWVHQPEICKVFGISTSYLTKSGVDTVAFNQIAGHNSLISYFEVVTLKLLRRFYEGEIVCQKTFSDLRSTKGRMLRFDFYIPEWNVAIEVDGPQHSDPNNPQYSLTLVTNDTLKNTYCKDNGIFLLRIPYPKVGRLTEAYVNTALLENLESFLTTTGPERVDVNV